jgi:hypothetical protein
MSYLKGPMVAAKESVSIKSHKEKLQKAAMLYEIQLAVNSKHSVRKLADCQDNRQYVSNAFLDKVAKRSNSNYLSHRSGTDYYYSYKPIQHTF